jgi:4-hydroxythreonine-4-phosphate dehydrogenase
MNTTTIVVSAGDPNGIGLEVLLKALSAMHTAHQSRTDAPTTDLTTDLATAQHTRERWQAVWQSAWQAVNVRVAVHPQTLAEYAAAMPWCTDFTLSADGEAFVLHGKRYDIVPCATYAPVQFGGTKHARQHANAGALASETASEAAGAMAWESLNIAAEMVNTGAADAVVTMPVSKYALQAVGFPFPGQTEFFAHACAQYSDGAAPMIPMMMLCTNSLPEPVRVALATIHVPLRRVADALTVELLGARLRQLHTALKQDFACAAPRIAVLGLNPHAGEQATLGTEERDVLEPALAQARSEGLCVEGAFAADGFFAHGAYRHYDGIVAMYHDQGLIPLKLLARGAGVNYSAGLPIVRTSPDHGTAFAIAGKGIANENSTIEAFTMAVEIVQNRRAVPTKQL